MIRSLSVLVMLASLSATADECALDAKSIVPQFSSKLPKGMKLLATKKEKRKVRQSLKLPDGLEASVEFGGCEHVQYSFGIKGGGLNTKTVGAEALAIAKRVLPTLPMSKDAMAEPKVLLTAIEEGSFTSLPATISCGSATCRIELVPDGKKKPAKKPAPKPKKGDPPAEADAPKAEEPEGPAILQLSYDAPI